MLSIYYVDGWKHTPRERGLLARLLPFLFPAPRTTDGPGEPAGRAVKVGEAGTYREASAVMASVDERELRRLYGPGFLVATNDQGNRVNLAPAWALAEAGR